MSFILDTPSCLPLFLTHMMDWEGVERMKLSKVSLPFDYSLLLSWIHHPYRSEH